MVYIRVNVNTVRKAEFKQIARYIMEYETEMTLTGLSSEEVAERMEAGLDNCYDISGGKTVKEIIRSNTLTYFNLIFLILSILICAVGSFRNLTFVPVVLCNMLVGIVQELRAKKVLDEMSLMNATHAVVIRNGTEQQIPSAELVQDDLIRLKAGDQICADAEVVEGSIYVNEALLTGEAEEIEKTAGDELLSGSFVVSGRCCARLVKVGKESYISRLSAQAKAMDKGEESEMIRSVNRLVKWVGILIIPVGILLFTQSYYLNGESLQKSIVSMTAAIVGMIPEGLYLLTTAALALGTIRLASHKVLLHDMKSIETLARVDVLCVDKTGTITEPDMEVTELIPCGQTEGMDENSLRQLLRDYIWTAEDDNATILALRRYIPLEMPAEENEQNDRLMAPVRSPLAVRPFSSALKYSAVTFQDGCFLLGAPEVILREAYSMVERDISPYLGRGCRVLLLGRYEGPLGDTLTAPVTPLGYVVLTNPVRENAAQTFSYFREQGVTVKVISGDNPETVSYVAMQAGIEHADRYIDASMLETEEQLEGAAKIYTVFGRVSPRQKQQLVQAMQDAGHTVAMTGDGVNDILAMKDADCSVAMASGSEAAAQAAQVVLLDSDFAHMPAVVLEGRRVVNNVQRSASLFLVKNMFSLLLSLFSVLFALTYPLEPAQISLISMFNIGIPGCLLALESNKNRIEGNFLRNVLVKAIPAGLADVLAVGSLVVCGNVFGLPADDIATACTMVLAVVGFIILFNISRPFNRFKVVILVGNILGLVFCSLFLSQMFSLSGMSEICILLTVVFSFAAESLYRYLNMLVERMNAFRLPRRRRKRRR